MNGCGEVTAGGTERREGGCWLLAVGYWPSRKKRKIEGRKGGKEGGKREVLWFLTLETIGRPEQPMRGKEEKTHRDEGASIYFEAFERRRLMQSALFSRFGILGAEG